MFKNLIEDIKERFVQLNTVEGGALVVAAGALFFVVLTPKLTAVIAGGLVVAGIYKIIQK